MIDIDIYDTMLVDFGTHKSYEPMNVGYLNDTYSNASTLTEENKFSYFFQLVNIPVRPQTVTFMIEGMNIPNIDDGYGNILGKGASGTINYVSGEVTITVSTPIASNKKLTVSYSQDFEIPEEKLRKKKVISLRINEKARCVLRLWEDEFLDVIGVDEKQQGPRIIDFLQRSISTESPTFRITNS